MRRSLKALSNRLAALHRDEQGDEGVNKILIIALIAIPLVIILLVFGKKIAEWFSEAWDNLSGNKNTGGFDVPD